jgi:SRSO17 transposase
VAQRRGFREYLAGLLAPRERNKTLTALAGAEPVTGSKLPAVQRLQFFVSESVWEPDAVNARRLELLRADPATAPHGGGVLVIDDSGDRKDGTRTAHVGRQYLGRYGKTDNGVVTVTTVWADERIYYPVHAVPYTPARHFARGRTTRSSGPSWRSARISRSGRGRPGSRSGRSSRTAPTATRTGSAPSWRRPGCRS